MVTLATIEEQVKEQQYEFCEESFYYFFKLAWQSFDPEPYLDNWHIGCIAEHLQAQSEGIPELRNLIVNIHPRLTKSKVISVAFPCWRWITNPIEKFVCVSHGEKLTKDLTTNSRDLIQSPWYSDRWVGSDKVFELKKDSNTVYRFDNNKGGYRFATTPRGGGLGFGYSHLLVDDMNDLMDIYSEPLLTAAVNFYKGVLRNRINNARTGKKTVVHQRLSELDITEWLLENEAGKWFHLMIPAEYDKSWTFVSPIGFDDPREKDGELVCPNRFHAEYYEEEKKDPYKWAALYQQKPRPAGGSIIKTTWIQFYQIPPMDHFDQMLISVDLAIEKDKEKKAMEEDSHDYTVYTVWGRRDAKYFLLDMIRDKLSFQEQLSTMVYLINKYPRARTRLVEKKANGSPLMSMLEQKVSGLVGINPIANKVERLYACVPEFCSGAVYFPHPEKAFWINDVINEITTFPKSKHDDIVDSVTMALNYLAISSAKTEAFMFQPDNNSKSKRLEDFNTALGERYEAAVYTKGSVRKIFSW